VNEFRQFLFPLCFVRKFLDVLNLAADVSTCVHPTYKKHDYGPEDENSYPKSKVKRAVRNQTAEISSFRYSAFLFPSGSEIHHGDSMTQMLGPRLSNSRMNYLPISRGDFWNARFVVQNLVCKAEPRSRSKENSNNLFE
jgi:hypothetical protein